MVTKKPKKKPPAEAGADVADEIFCTMAALEGFDIQGFDRWHAALDDCGAKLELAERRAWAKAEIKPGAINREALLRHLEWMLLRWKYIKREEYILPLARAGKAIDTGRKKPKRPVVQAWIEAEVRKNTGETAEQLFNRAPEWLTDQLALDRFRKRYTTARKSAGLVANKKRPK